MVVEEAGVGVIAAVGEIARVVVAAAVSEERDTDNGGQKNRLKLRQRGT